MPHWISSCFSCAKKCRKSLHVFRAWDNAYYSTNIMKKWENFEQLPAVLAAHGTLLLQSLTMVRSMSPCFYFTPVIKPPVARLILFLIRTFMFFLGPSDQRRRVNPIIKASRSNSRSCYRWPGAAHCVQGKSWEEGRIYKSKFLTYHQKLYSCLISHKKFLFHRFKIHIPSIPFSLQ